MCGEEPTCHFRFSMLSQQTELSGSILSSDGGCAESVEGEGGGENAAAVEGGE